MQYENFEPSTSDGVLEVGRPSPNHSQWFLVSHDPVCIEFCTSIHQKNVLQSFVQ